jgi:hypothetical protein
MQRETLSITEAGNKDYGSLNSLLRIVEVNSVGADRSAIPGFIKDAE